VLVDVVDMVLVDVADMVLVDVVVVILGIKTLPVRRLNMKLSNYLFCIILDIISSLVRIDCLPAFKKKTAKKVKIKHKRNQNLWLPGSQTWARSSQLNCILTVVSNNKEGVQQYDSC